MIQGDPVALTIFNIVVEVVVRAFLLELCRPQDLHHRLFWEAGEHNIVFYVEYGHVEGCNPIWVQKTLTAVLRMFERVLMLTNLGKTKPMVFNPGSFW